METQSQLENLVQLSRKGDRGAFDKITRHFHARIESIVRLRIGQDLRRRIDVDDVVQETYMRAFKGISNFEWESEPQFRAWLCKIAERTCTDVVRQHVISQKQSIDKELQGGLGPKSDGGQTNLLELLSLTQTRPSGYVRREERLTRLEQAMDSLSDRHKEVILLSVIQRISTQEVAERMDMSIQAVCMLRTRALRKLKDLFGETESLRLPDRRAFEGEGE